MLKQFTRRLICLCFGIAITGAVFSLPARAAETDPADFLRALADDAIAVLSDDHLDQTGRAQGFRQVLRRGFDIPAVSRFVLGRYWRAASRVEKEEFVQLFEDYMVAVYGGRLGRDSGKFLTVTSQRADGIDGAIVSSNIKRPDGPVIMLDWRLKQGDHGWQVVDIMAEGMSLALAQRSEFASVIRANGGKLSSLLTKLRQKTQTLALNQGTLRQTNADASTQ
ncbi:MAG: ABC transporter substrate-binding protein [Proteobacteria bacterium]|nr:ABC transporter substrate-binding protein [Pseudomonadota bacterium]